MILHTNEAGTLSAHAQDEYVKLEWKSGERSQEQIIELFNRTLEEAVARDWNKMLVDQTNMNASGGGVEAWFLQDWLARSAAHYTVAYCAIVTPQTLEARFSTLSMMRGAYQHHANMPMHLCRTEEQAVAWLRECPNQTVESLWPAFVQGD